MRIKGQQTGKSPLPLGGIQGALNHRLMAEVDPVKHPESEMQGLTQILEFFEATANLHVPC